MIAIIAFDHHGCDDAVARLSEREKSVTLEKSSVCSHFHAKMCPAVCEIAEPHLKPNGPTQRDRDRDSGLKG